MELLERAFTTSQRFSALPLEEKLKAPHPEGMTPHRGYSGLCRNGEEQKGPWTQMTREEMTRSCRVSIHVFKKRKHS